MYLALRTYIFKFFPTLAISHIPEDPRPALIYMLLHNLVISNSKLALKSSEIFKEDKLSLTWSTMTTFSIA